MTNLEKYNNAFIKAFDLKDDQVNESLAYQQTDGWDSVGHMQLIVELEDAFDIFFEPDDMIGLVSYSIGKEILAKMGIEL